ncbi:MAG: adenylyltransferase/cytidyltransferase family protein [Patescibacteria group bacterium]
MLAFGVFDLLHPGHKYFLRQAKKQGQQLIVIVARDKVIKLIKKQLPINNQNKRLAQIKKLPFVHLAKLGNRSPQHNYSMIKLIKPDVLALGYDQATKITILKKTLKKLNLNPKIIRLKAYKPKLYKSNIIRSKLKVSLLSRGVATKVTNIKR